MLQIQCRDETHLAAIAADLGSIIPVGTAILLNGDLGAGKTSFARAFIRSLTGNAALEVTSPTFNLMSAYDTSTGPIYHYDLYRVKHPSEVEELGFDQIRSARTTIIEWPDRLGNVKVPAKTSLTINIAITGENTRTITLEPHGFGVMPDTAFVFAAGLGKRMRHLTQTTPKPLVPVAGRPTLAYIFDQLREVGIKRVFLNTHYLAEQVNNFVEAYRREFDITILHEDILLETGGGLRRALPFIDREFFFAMNGDALQTEGPGLPHLARLALSYRPQDMDLMLLVANMESPRITDAHGDYTVDDVFHLVTSPNKTGTHFFAGPRILASSLFDGVAEGKFSFLDQMKAAEANRRLYGLEHTGMYHHISTPEDVDAVTAYMQGDQTARAKTTAKG